ncbi:Lysophospholipid_acyltransferase [Hexamita inflata]|uniref:Lysophospholipid acyltransferase n=1 Tax=Hexamita inflata TaxID=28002 RepID=A0AA86NAK2_9EUKA|nr:Lysophospholipid acyltransferase [Hexamita inflata]
MKEIPLTKPNPFAKVVQKKTLGYYLYWGLSWLLAPILFPIRVIIIIFSSVVTTTILKFLTKDIDINKPLHPVKTKLIQKMEYFGGLLYCLGSGRYFIKEINPQLKPDLKTANVCICNHVSSFDPCIFLRLGFQSFVAKEELRKMPVFGICTWAGQGLFVKRDNKQSSEIISKIILDRTSNDIQSFGYPRKYPVLMIFPEGTTVNQTALMPFKKGAFMGGKPVSMISLRYQQKYFDPSDTSSHMVTTQFWPMIGLWQTIEVEYFGDYIPNDQEVADPQLYADNVRNFYSEKLNQQKTDCTLKDKMYYFGKHSDYSICSQYYKDNYGPEVTRKNGYVVQHWKK